MKMIYVMIYSCGDWCDYILSNNVYTCKVVPYIHVRTGKRV